MKKARFSALAVLLALTLLLALFAACGTPGENSGQSAPDDESAQTSDAGAAGNEQEDGDGGEENALTGGTIAVGALKGPTGMGMAPLMTWAAQGETVNDYSFTLDSAPDIIQGKLVSGELDIAALPTNVAAVLHERTEGGVKLLAINTLGVLSIVQAPGVEIASIEDLAGRTIYTAGQGSTQEYVLAHLLDLAGLTDSVKVEYGSEHAEVATMLLTGDIDLALLPQPFVTNVLLKDETLRIALDVTEEWERASGGTALVMGCLAIRTEFLEENPEAVTVFLEEYYNSTTFVNENVDEAAEMIGALDIIDAEVARLAIPRCNIVCLTGQEMMESAQGYLAAIAEQNPTAVGGSLPDEGFYYLP